MASFLLMSSDAAFAGCRGTTNKIVAQSAEGPGGQPRGQCEAELNQAGQSYNTSTPTSQTYFPNGFQPFPCHSPRSPSLQPEHWPSTCITTVEVGV